MGSGLDFTESHRNRGETLTNNYLLYSIPKKKKKRILSLTILKKKKIKFNKNSIPEKLNTNPIYRFKEIRSEQLNDSRISFFFLLSLFTKKKKKERKKRKGKKWGPVHLFRRLSI